jgi:hypothetical protein
MRKGQALVLILLILGVAMTVALAVVSRSVTEVSVSTVQEESARALEAAETGIEQSLGGLIAGSGSGRVPVTNASFNVSNASLGGGSVYEVPYKLDAGDVATADLNGYSAGNFRVCWGSATGSAVEVILYFRRADTSVGVGRLPFDSVAGRGNGFDSTVVSGCPGGPGGYASSRLINFSDFGMVTTGPPASRDTPLFLRVRVLYNPTPQPLAFLAQGSADFPSQATEIISTGQSGDASQKIRVVQMNPDLPAVFDSAIFSGTSLTQ